MQQQNAVLSSSPLSLSVPPKTKPESASAPSEKAAVPTQRPDKQKEAVQPDAPKDSFEDVYTQTQPKAEPDVAVAVTVDANADMQHIVPLDLAGAPMGMGMAMVAPVQQGQILPFSSIEAVISPDADSETPLPEEGSAVDVNIEGSTEEVTTPVPAPTVKPDVAVAVKADGPVEQQVQTQTPAPVEVIAKQIADTTPAPASTPMPVDTVKAAAVGAPDNEKAQTPQKINAETEVEVDADTDAPVPDKKPALQQQVATPVAPAPAPMAQQPEGHTKTPLPIDKPIETINAPAPPVAKTTTPMQTPTSTTVQMQGSDTSSPTPINIAAPAPSPVTTPAPVTPTVTPLPQVFMDQQAPQVVSQIAATIVKADGDQKVTLRLDPPELGKVDIDMKFTERGITVVVSAERSESVDLMRRNANELLRELRQSGLSLSSSDMSFQQHKDNPKQQSTQEAGLYNSAFDETETTLHLTQPTLRPLTQTTVPTDRLDMRL